MPLVRSCIVATWLLSAAGAASAAEITLDKFDVFDGRTHHMHIEGRIEPGDTARVRALTASLPAGRDEMLVVSLNSPGGSVQEGLDIARTLQAMDLNVIVDVMTRDGDPGICASACSYVFVGGTYRFLSAGSQLGVHQFRFVDDDLVRLSEVTRDVQNRSADITALLSDANVDPGFFSLMGATAPDDMTWVDLTTLERFNVVNRERAYQDNAFTLKGGAIKLVMTHIGLYGINRLTVQCLDSDVIFSSEILLSDPLDLGSGQSDGAEIPQRFDFNVMIDRFNTAPILHETQTYADQAITTVFGLPADQLAAILASDLVDVRLVEKSGAFIGAGFDVSDGKIKDMVESCVDLSRHPASRLEGLQDTQTTLSPVFVAASLGAARRGQPLSEGSDVAVSPEEMAVTLYNDYLAAWSKPNELALPLMNARYGDVLDFYGAEMTKDALMSEKITFAERWPERRYAARPGTFEISCPDASSCLVASIIDWEAHSAARGKSASGVAWYGLGFDMETGLVLFEDGKSQKR
ncbi:hypothetical protein AN189_06265 [Loktanella sp. 3ANDIMAR09]|uniref:ATP-dependent Clp protease proteolytic subunit n=1 Tax=Loktanella sp. 3ANDIMAR09 TaxID=1225657 RepID=UPI0006F4D4E2|nr:ATP-dependent Clp protease proteolytic subunit [Loktanella sp. 3ANDIMAR09]KQI69171.1 hypothetical protein AN189_06265 [Loktanella sp. 3ANDIMAR09]